MFYANVVKGNIKFKKYNALPFNNLINHKLDAKTVPFGRCDNLYNFNTYTGALTDGIGISDIELVYENYYDMKYKTVQLPSAKEITGCYFLKYWHEPMNQYLYLLMIYCHDGKILYNMVNSINSEWTEIDNLQFSSKPMALYSKVNGVDSLIFYTENDGMFVWNMQLSKPIKVDNPPKITSMCIHDNRLFATIKGDARSVIFSEELNPTNFNVSTEEGGYINMSDDFGKCNKVVSFDGYLYVFRDYNIARITEGRDRNEFVVTQLYVGNGKIYPNTVSVCGDKIMFLAADGVYKFDGTTAKKINFDFDDMIVGIDNHNAIGQYFDGNYYLACVIDFEDEVRFGCESLTAYHNNALIKINMSTDYIEVHRGCDISGLTLVNDGLNNCIIVTYTFDSMISTIGILKESGSLKSKMLKKFWKSEMHDFDLPNKLKFIKDITLITHSDITLNIYLDDKIKKYNVKGKSSAQSIKINERFTRLGFGFESDTNGVYITIPQVKVGIYEE